MIVVTVPAFNECSNLEKCVKSLIEKSLQLNEEFRIVIAEDGSTDGTQDIAKKLEAEYPLVTHIHSQQKLGRGKALKNAWKRTQGEIYVFVDADLATNMKDYPNLIKYIKNGYDLATGSRYISGAKVDRPLLRNFVSKAYNALIRVIFQDGVFDHQIGFKAFSKNLIDKELNNCKSDSWFWDTEIVVRSIRNNYKFIEFPVEWKEKKTNRTRPVRLFSDILVNGIGLIKLKKNLQ